MLYSANPCRYCVESPLFRERFGQILEPELFGVVVGYSGAQRGGTLGEAEVVLNDRNGERHVFVFETFSNSHEALTLGYWLRPHFSGVLVQSP